MLPYTSRTLALILSSWEITLRSVEFILQLVIEGRESLWGAQSLRDKHLPEFLLSTLRVLTLHPKTPANQRAKDRRDRFARIHRSLEQVFDSYPGSNSFLLLVCKEVTDSLRNDPDSLALPLGLKYELPNLASELVLKFQKYATKPRRDLEANTCHLVPLGQMFIIPKDISTCTPR